VVIKSAIKTWKNNRDLLFPWLSEETNLNYALLHLTRLEEYVYNSTFENIIERGVSDMMFYEYQKSPNLITASIIQGAINRELEILEHTSGEVEKILMVMKDEDFIINKTLSEKTRAQWFRGVQDYLEKQSEYVDFTKKYNKIDQEIVIKDARKYLSDLGIEYV
jgi:hypothetical protein